VDTYILNPTPTLRIRRRHSTEFKQELIGLCQPGVSISAIALAHGVNANHLRPTAAVAAKTNIQKWWGVFFADSYQFDFVTK
jgi:hypothetical protein